ncbi:MULTISPECIES: protein-disulfide reductase DsbD family protein [unclassified Sphingomonas]|uniref:protein-disulfide reductase DsbD family protein n=1 Tax=unclassified Sphingomonas TaxID=196159 RepID=UPI0006FB80EE|nr:MULTISPECIES: thioredoxin family protein [unclassified Sphingomonas]KQX18364.1 thiol:disulfide interchange protein [Sphingomonas sp. Root1294]KQY72311.1 thiol:disulfide interchange protein [Sphingomonas sp. Root50]KRB94418.1 thiol:disulfide interchange protein [Sphingomonas sp. Root720]
MTSIGRLIHLCIALLLVAAGATAAPAAHIRATLEAETLRPAAGSRVTLALSMAPEKDWHGYWQNPGDAGAPADIAWTLPRGADVGPPRYPVPQRLIVAGLMNYVYERPYALLMTLTVPKGLPSGTPLRIAGKARWLACSPTICVPEQGPVAIELTVGDGAVTAASRARFDRWRARLPMPLGQAASFEASAGRVRLAIPFPKSRPIADPYFYPATDGVIDYAAPQAISRRGDRLIVDLKAARSPQQVPAIEGLIAIGPDRGLMLTARPGKVPAAGVPIAGPGDESSGGSLRTFLLAVGGALLGGLLLNAMPCVFPILSLKALSLARSGETDAQARIEAVAYSVGIVLSCMALGAALLALRAGGAAAGWGFQLQDPRMVFALLLLVTAISLNLAGLFELRVVGIGEAMTKGRGAVPAFWTGVLAALIATPCSGPFMAGAVGAALLLPPAAAIAVFAGLGLGLALPFLLIGFVPGLRRLLPKPGAWMDRLRRILSVPMFATALGLAWVLGQQAGVDRLVQGIGVALLLGLTLWWVGMRQAQGKRLSWIPVLPALAAAGAVLLLTPAAGSPAMAAATDKDAGEPFSEARLAALQAEHKPVFVYFTADWCLTCKVNEKAAIERPAVREAFAEGGVAVLVGDWTNGDPAIGRFLEAQGRSGVPLYLFYHRDGRVETLPQVLSTGLLRGLAA